MNTADRAKRIPELDGLRGTAILFVILFHFTAAEGTLPAHTFGSVLQRVTSMGWTGVDLFFVLSGFLIGGILIDVRQSPRYWKTFYLRRFLRIIPVYYLWIVAYVLLMRVAGPAIQARSFSGRGVVLGPAIYEHFLFAQNIWIAALPGMAGAWFGHTWSLAVEEQFYLDLAADHSMGVAAAPSRSFSWGSWWPHRFCGRPCCCSCTTARG